LGERGANERNGRHAATSLGAVGTAGVNEDDAGAGGREEGADLGGLEHVFQVSIVSICVYGGKWGLTCGWTDKGIVDGSPASEDLGFFVDGTEKLDVEEVEQL